MFSAVLHKPKREQQEPVAAKRHEHVRGDKFVALLEPAEGREGPCLTHADRSVAGRCSCRRSGNGEWRDPPLHKSLDRATTHPNAEQRSRTAYDK